MADDSSDLSSLSSLSPAPSGDESEIELKPQNGILKFFHRVSKDEATEATKKEMSPPPRKREPSPPHQHVFADNPDIAFIVMFRKRFDPVMPRSLAHFGPLELEQDILQDPPAERVEHFLCVVLGLLLNRKQDIKYAKPFQMPPPRTRVTYSEHRVGHYHKALNEDAINGPLFKPQWPRSWNGQSLLAGGATFHTITPEQRVNLLKTLIIWALSHSDAVKAMVNTFYNQHKRTTDDLTQPLSVQPWGQDSDKRRYYLVEGDDNCSFRIYREGNPAALYNRPWISAAGSIDEAKALAEKLATVDGGQHSRKLSKSILNNIVNFEEKEEKRKRREYRRQQKERFRRPEPGFSMYEGRTRGKRVKYTYSDDEDFMTDSTGNRRSTRNTRNPSPIETGPVVTASGRQSRPPARLAADNLSNGDASAAPSVQGDATLDGAGDIEMSEAPEIGPGGRPRRSAAVHHGTNGWDNPRKRRKEYTSDDEEEDESEPDFGDDEEEDHVPQDETEDEEEFENEAVEDDDEVAAASPDSTDSRVVKLHIKVKFDKDGKAKKLPKSGHSSSASTPSNVASSPDAVDSQSDNSSSDIPDHEPERTADEITAAPLKRGGPEPASATVPPPSSTAAATSDDLKPESRQHDAIVTKNGDTKPETLSTISVINERKIDLPPRVPSTPGPGGVAASLAFRGSPEKPHAVMFANRD
ncbi:hypothetical protein VPNG_00732 [Cytospora leucostoma]|uniref:WHIM1 domain-containing protein n=1 Tax=Cytospora leucostoma TaxID=1230097 RepID=A0A423XLW7_9PEZI|nr:hypothetical protein VPNG_00732 [Cytospora leucostoma]